MKVAHRSDVLERVPADHRRSVDLGQVLGEEAPDPVRAAGHVVGNALGVHAGVDAQAAAGARPQHLDEELALAAADLDDVLAVRGRSGRPSRARPRR